MKFIIQLIANVLVGFITSISQALTGKRRGKNDFYFFICAISLIGVYFIPWAGVVTFLALLPPLRDQLSLQDISTKHNSDALKFQEPFGDNSTKEELKNICEVIAPAKTESRPSERNQESSDIKEDCKGVEKKRVAKADWGIPSLKVVDFGGRIIPVNPDKPTPIESEYFKGHILIMLKCDGEYAEYNRYADHFQGKNRKFEVQFQVV
jgi:hypothetical protein